MHYAVHIAVTYSIGLESTTEKAAHLMAPQRGSYQDPYMELGPRAHQAIFHTPIISTLHCG
jgi:hypothetical protein